MSYKLTNRNVALLPISLRLFQQFNCRFDTNGAFKSVWIELLGFKGELGKGRREKKAIMKAQNILNIILNAVINGQSVAVVPSYNSHKIENFMGLHLCHNIYLY